MKMLGEAPIGEENDDSFIKRVVEMSSFHIKKLDPLKKIVLNTYPLKAPEVIQNRLKRLPRGHVFTYLDLADSQCGKEALVKALNRMVASGQLAKLSKGRYYQPETTPFGELQPSQYQVVKDLLLQNGKPVGYLTGLSVFPELGLSTQVSHTIQIGKNDIRPSLKRGPFIIEFIKQKNTITLQNIPLLRLLDALRLIKKIPDSSEEIICRRMREILSDLEEHDQKRMVRLALKYPPATRAILGALLTDLGNEDLTAPLKKSLNPLTTYSFPQWSTILPQAKDWNIQ